MKKKMKNKSRLSLCLVLMLLFVMLMPVTSMAAQASTREEFDAFGPGADEFMIQTTVSTTAGENDGYITISPPAGDVDKFMTYMNEKKTLYRKTTAPIGYDMRITIYPNPGKKIASCSVDNGSGATQIPLNLDANGTFTYTVTSITAAETDKNKISIDVTFVDAEAPGVPTNIRWDGETVKWDAPASGADCYVIRTGYGSYINGVWKNLYFVSQEMTVTQSECDVSGSSILDDNIKCMAVLYITSVKNGVRSEMVHSETYAQHIVPNDYSYDEDYHRKECENCGLCICFEEHDFGDDSVCDVCSYGGTTYKFLEGMDGSWTQKSDKTLKFRADGEFSKFSKVKIDGVEISSDKYTASEGSTIIELKKDYLGTLSVGEHSITVVYTDGACATKFKILKAPGTTTEAPATTQAPTITEAPATTQAPTTTAITESQTPAGTSPATGDGVNIGMLLALLVLSGMGILTFISFNKKANR